MDYLSTLHPHERDTHITFDEGPHIYTIDGDSDFMSVTTWNHSHFEHFDADAIIGNMMRSKRWAQNKYYGMTPDEIKAVWDKNRDEAAEAGTAMHLDIERFYNQEAVENDDGRGAGIAPLTEADLEAAAPYLAFDQGSKR